ncbi:response regulator [Uliginosibacterium sp. 31-12]|uniref:response regulator n=1 Tax=Uliginosibacterium sp. 31-12 TaxID=3062781 RepID=UPI0026E274AE|nr:response regulator [Uliginosibacterium sp. 31-12]MDO6385357.1 response regulator [Uliginosibacterium sp. 31-12]
MQIGVDTQRAVENRRVFVIDSDDVVSAGLQFMLADEMETHVFASSAEALAKARSWPPELAIVGAALLEQEGAAVISKLREALPQLRILVVCFDAEDAMVKEALALGAASTLLRPLKLENVRRKVDAQLGRRTALEIPVVVR